MPDYAASCVAVLALFVQGHCVRHDQTELHQRIGAGWLNVSKRRVTSRLVRRYAITTAQTP